MPNLPWTHRSLYQLTILGVALGQQIVNTHHFEADAAYDLTHPSDADKQTDSAALALDWVTNMKSLYLACLPNDYSMTMVTCQVLETNGSWRHRLTPAESAQTGLGTDATNGQAEDIVTSGVIRWRTPIAGKRHRGRNYIGPLGNNAISDGRLIAGVITKLTAYADGMRNRYTGAGASAGKWPLTVYSRPFNQGEYGYVRGSGSNREFYYPPDYAGNSTWVTTTSVDSIARTQRRRQLGVGS